MDSVEPNTKSSKCLNCKKELADEFKFCPYCGQKNTNTNLSFGQLAGDFLTNYFTLDSKFVRSIIPFLFKPGALTLRFIEGERQSYANPVRLYIIISFFYFFVLSFLAGNMAEAMKPVAKAQLSNDSTEIAEVVIGDTLQTELFDTLSEKKKYVIPTNSGATINVDTSSGWPLSSEQWNVFFSKETQDMTADQLYDSMRVENRTPFNQHVVRQMIRVKKSDKEFVWAFFFKNLSIMMFLLLPIFALILKLLYVRRKTLFIKHLVHTLHIHSFAFLIYGLSLSVTIWLVDIS